MRGSKKETLPTKICPVCQRPFTGCKNGRVIGMSRY
ncbi:MAG: DUF2256 domain-containing protein [Anaerolineales bacterium]|nr:DUF2256 domain-containing protein [Anaerolineales bacterium]